MIHYYSFYLGEPGTPKSSWKFDDCKLPAADPKSAVMLHFFLQEYINRKKQPWLSNKDKFYAPGPYMTNFRYRGLIEWIKVDRKSYGRTLVQFKKNKFVSQFQLETKVIFNSYSDI